MSERKPRIGILGIMQDLYDDMIPGIAQRQEGYAAELAAHLSDVGEFIPSKPIKYREDAERAMREFEGSDLDGLMVVMLTYGPAMRVARLLSESRLPVLLANIQPEPNVTPAWDMDDMTYNQGVHGAQDTANAMVRGGKRFVVLTDDWKSDSFRDGVSRWARAAAAVTRWKSLKTAIFGYAMNDMGDIRVDESALIRSLGPEILAVAQGDMYRGMLAVTGASLFLGISACTSSCAMLITRLRSARVIMSSSSIKRAATLIPSPFASCAMDSNVMFLFPSST